MYYSDKIIDWEYFYKTTPNWEWKKMSNRMLTKKVSEAYDIWCWDWFENWANHIRSSI